MFEVDKEGSITDEYVQSESSKAIMIIKHLCNY